MAYSFSADAVQYSTGDAYYLRSQAGTEGPVVIDADLRVTGDLQVDKGAVFQQSVDITQNLAVGGDIVSRDGTAGRVALQLTGSPANPSVAFGDVTAPGQFCALNYDAGGATMSLIGSNPTFIAPGGLASGAGLDVSQGGSLALAVNDTMDVRVPVLGRAGATFWSGGSGKVSLSGGGVGPTAFGTVQSFANDGTTITPLQLQPAGGSVSIPSLTNGSLLSVPTIPVQVDARVDGQPTGTFVIAGVRVMWGFVNSDGFGSANIFFTPNFSALPAIYSMPVQNGPAVGYSTLSNTPTASQCNITFTTSGGTGFACNAYWLAIGPA